jgi:BR serine/threonine kinase
MRRLLQKVVSGKFIMPDFFDDPVCDIIHRLLTVDPERRITMKQLKEHPVFRVGLPDRYVLPSPLPIPNLSEPLPDDAVDGRVVAALVTIGYPSHDVVRQELRSADHTQAKVFYRLLVQLISWDQPHSGDSQSANNEQFLMSPTQLHDSLDPQVDILGRSRRTADPQPADIIRSLAAPAAWGSVTIGEGSEVVELIQSVALPLSTVMDELQDLMNQQGYQWCHPNAFKMIIRNSRTDLVVSIHARCEAVGLFSLSLCQRQGQPTDFHQLVCAVLDRFDV